MAIGKIYLLSSAIVLSILATSLALYWMRYEIVDGSNWLKYRAYGVIILAIGFLIHSIGDFLETPYGPVTTLSVETFAHVIILIGFILFFYAAKENMKISKEHGFG